MGKRLILIFMSITQLEHYIIIWFTDWNNYPSMLCHGVMMGVVVEGIDFYGIGELSLFFYVTMEH